MTAPKLRGYLLPLQSFTETFLPDIHLNPSVISNSSTATCCFHPGEHLDHNWLPYHVECTPHLLRNMHSHFWELLDNYTTTNKPVTFDTSAAYQTACKSCHSHSLGGKPSVSLLAIYILQPVRTVYGDLTGQEFIVNEQIPAEMRTSHYHGSSSYFLCWPQCAHPLGKLISSHIWVPCLLSRNMSKYRSVFFSKHNPAGLEEWGSNYGKGCMLILATLSTSHIFKQIA